MTDIHWCPSGGTRRQSTQADIFVLACTDGKFLLVSRLGRVEKTVDAHKGAVLGARWSGDSTALMTCECPVDLLSVGRGGNTYCPVDLSVG